MIRRNRDAERAKDEEVRLFRRLHLEISMEAVIAGAALLLSLVTAFVQIFDALRGPVISAMPIDSALLYWDGTKSGAVLTAAFETKLFNTASADHGDIVESATLVFRTSGLEPVEFPLQSLIQPHMIDDPEKVVDRCDLVDRCIPLDGLVIVELPDRLIALPGGSARSDYLTFALTSFNCRGRGADCKRFSNFDAAVRTLSGRTVRVEIALHFHEAATRRLECQIRRIDGARLEKHRWLSFNFAT